MTRRIRHIAGALGLITVALIATTASAGASEESIGSCIVEKIDELEQSGGDLHELEAEGGDALVAFEDDLEKCVEAPSLILPAIEEIIWGSSAFLILFVFMMWKGLPAVQGAMTARSEKIAADLDEAEKAKTDAVSIRSDHAAELAGAKAEAAGIIDAARAQAGEVKADLQARAEADIAEMRSRAQADIESGRTQAIADLRAEVSEIAVGAAERVIRSNLDPNTQRALVDAYIDEVAGRG